jgi:uncharacterized protein YozE (UPF0346 family)
MKTRSCFNTWLATARATDDPEGDVIEDARGDPTFPATITDMEALHGYLAFKGACPEALAIVPQVWRRYARWAR